MDFAYDALKAAHRTAQLIKNPRGKQTNINLDTLVVSKNTTNHFKALELLGAIKKDRIAESTDNDGSGVMGYKILALPWIQTNTDYWFMFDSGKKEGQYCSLQYKESQPILKEGPNAVFKTGEIQYKATVMFDIGHNDYRNMVGSKNTNSA